MKAPSVAVAIDDFDVIGDKEQGTLEDVREEEKERRWKRVEQILDEKGLAPQPARQARPTPIPASYAKDHYHS